MTSQREDIKSKCGTCLHFRGESQECKIGLRVESSYYACEEYLTDTTGARRILHYRGFGFVLCVMFLVLILFIGIIIGGIWSIITAFVFIFGLFGLILSGLMAGQRWWKRRGGPSTVPRYRLVIAG